MELPMEHFIRESGMKNTRYGTFFYEGRKFMREWKITFQQLFETQLIVRSLIVIKKTV